MSIPIHYRPCPWLPIRKAPRHSAAAHDKTLAELWEEHGLMALEWSISNEDVS